MNHLTICGTLGALALLLSSCAEGPTERIALTGSSTLAPLMSEIAKRYEAEHVGLRIDVQTGGSSRGIADTRTGVADIGMSSRTLKESEEEGRVTYTIAMDGVALLVNANNPITRLSDEEIVGIYTGEIENWEDVGGNDAPINVVNRAEGRSELELFEAFFDLEPEDFAVDLISGENQHGIKTVASDENAIIYMSIGASQFEVDNGTPIKLLPLRGVAPTEETVASGEYPLNRPLILITPLEPSQTVTDFIVYAMSATNHDLIEQQSYVPTTP